ncbi:RNA polymerase sigma factor [Thalassoglobus polymorphus]|uniref:ECF RNA polymerase sigma factor SigE n=1 Tax=Thalassoglobus polymorphus TaxID=2527994 RepID=A0A517QKG0_9PLAN|nr:RNA polymerase sigma factor [Thalassoglobus polymorphus]QDT32113.1 ECF RNA polymerase sigma factor SigE [Thalassoglobus polymorphus]
MSLLSHPKQPANHQDPGPDALVSDAELLSQFLKLKNEAAFTALVERYGHMVFAVAVRIVRDRHSAEDVAQATFLLLAKDAKKIRRRESLSSWLHGVAIRLAKKALKRRSREKVNDVVTELEIAEKTFEEIHSTFEQQVLDEELQGLPKQYRDPLVLHFLQGKTYEEIAQFLGVTLGAIEGRMKRGKRELQLRVAKRGVGLGAALAALSWSQTEAVAAIRPEFIHTIAQNGLAAFQGTAFTPACSPEAVYLAGKEVTMFTTTKIAFLTCSLAIAAGAGWMSHVGFAQDGSGDVSKAQGASIDTAVAQFGAEDQSPKPTIKQRIQAQKERDAQRGINSLGADLGADIGGFGSGGEDAFGSGVSGTDGASYGGVSSAGGVGMEAKSAKLSDQQLLELFQALQETEKLLEEMLKQSAEGEGAATANVQELVQALEQLRQLKSQHSGILGESMRFELELDEMMGFSQANGNPGAAISVEHNQSPAEEKIEAALETIVGFEFPGNMLSDVAALLSEQHEIPILIDEEELSNEGLSVDDEVKATVSGVSMRNGLELMLEPLELTYVIKNDVLMITTNVKAGELTETRVYDVRPLQVHDPEALADVLLHTIEPESWSEMGGNGDISFLNGSLVVMQSQKVHGQIEILLNQLARQSQKSPQNPDWPARDRSDIPGTGGAGGAGGFFGGGN